MTPTEALAYHDAILEGLNATDAYCVEHQMTSALLALCHAQQLEILRLRVSRDLAREDLARYTRAQVA